MLRNTETLDDPESTLINDELQDQMANNIKYNREMRFLAPLATLSVVIAIECGKRSVIFRDPQMPNEKIAGFVAALASLLISMCVVVLFVLSILNSVIPHLKIRYGFTLIDQTNPLLFFLARFGALFVFWGILSSWYPHTWMLFLILAVLFAIGFELQGIIKIFLCILRFALIFFLINIVATAGMYIYSNYIGGDGSEPFVSWVDLLLNVGLVRVPTGKFHVQPFASTLAKARADEVMPMDNFLGRFSWFVLYRDLPEVVPPKQNESLLGKVASMSYSAAWSLTEYTIIIGMISDLLQTVVTGTNQNPWYIQAVAYFVAVFLWNVFGSTLKTNAQRMLAAPKLVAADLLLQVTGIRWALDMFELPLNFFHDHAVTEYLPNMDKNRIIETTRYLRTYGICNKEDLFDIVHTLIYPFTSREIQLRNAKTRFAMEFNDLSMNARLLLRDQGFMDINKFMAADFSAGTLRGPDHKSYFKRLQQAQSSVSNAFQELPISSEIAKRFADGNVIMENLAIYKELFPDMNIELAKELNDETFQSDSRNLKYLDALFGRRDVADLATLHHVADQLFHHSCGADKEGSVCCTGGLQHLLYTQQPKRGQYTFKLIANNDELEYKYELAS